MYNESEPTRDTRWPMPGGCWVSISTDASCVLIVLLGYLWSLLLLSETLIIHTAQPSHSPETLLLALELQAIHQTLISFSPPSCLSPSLHMLSHSQSLSPSLVDGISPGELDISLWLGAGSGVSVTIRLVLSGVMSELEKYKHQVCTKCVSWSPLRWPSQHITEGYANEMA